MNRKTIALDMTMTAVADPGGRGRHAPLPLKISHRKDGRWRRPHRFHVSRPLPSSRSLDPLLDWEGWRWWVKEQTLHRRYGRLTRKLLNLTLKHWMYFVFVFLFTCSFINAQWSPTQINYPELLSIRVTPHLLIIPHKGKLDPYPTLHHWNETHFYST